MKIIPLIIFLVSTSLIYTQTFLKVGEVFDFEVGDEFHYELPHAPSNADRVTITSKSISSNQDTVCYGRSHSKFQTVLNSGIINFSTFTEVVCYTNLDSLIVDLNFITPDSNYMYYDTISHYDTISYCNKGVNGYNYAGDGFEPMVYSKIWGRGLGLIVDHFSQPGDPSSPVYETRLFYYKKGNVSCGIPDYTSVEKYKEEQLTVYPNPVKSCLTIQQNNEEMEKVIIYNTLGEVVLIKNLESLNTTLNLMDLPKGAYFLKIKSKSETVTKNIFKI